MSDDRLRDEDAIERLLDDSVDQDDLQPLAEALRGIRASARTDALEPDHRLADMFEGGRPTPAPTPRKRWLDRPAAAFAAAFLAVLVIGVSAFGLANRGSSNEVAASTSTSMVDDAGSDSTPAAGETVVDVPPEVGESVAEYLGCVVSEIGEYLKRKVTDSQLLDRPNVLGDCGVPAIPSLGEEAEAFRVDLNAWLSCASDAFDAMLPELITDPTAINDPLEECGTPPNPADYGITFDFGDLNFLDDIKLPDIDLDELFEKFRESLPDDLLDRLPQDFEAPDLDKLFEDFKENLPEDFDLDFFKDFEGFEDFDFQFFFDGEGFEEFDREQLEQLWRDLGEKLPDVDGLFDGFFDKLPEDFEFGDFESWFNGELFLDGEACEKLQELGLIDDCDDVTQGTSTSA